ncbi:hypothetical protein [Komagataeibacter sp. FNDCF1]|uniref:hypothetical protein n=1 Tax=Komagataeibacter sp. FNDCF1 TaxID=2878681 RepID=UPI001E52B417|nr:hypothetical protein [Komagataeibacter sp. FNDCF1]MCE2565405.1 hypothetical protein [Komagataeibacter sp. FNDCF1]
MRAGVNWTQKIRETENSQNDTADEGYGNGKIQFRTEDNPRTAFQDGKKERPGKRFLSNYILSAYRQYRTATGAESVQGAHCDFPVHSTQLDLTWLDDFLDVFWPLR